VTHVADSPSITRQASSFLRTIQVCKEIFQDPGAGRSVLVSGGLCGFGLWRPVDAVLGCGFRKVLSPLVVICAEVLVAEGHLEEASKRLCEALNS
jgi:hypothetical protein